MSADDPYHAQKVRVDRHQGHRPAAALIDRASPSRLLLVLAAAIGVLSGLAGNRVWAGGFDRISLNVPDPRAAADWYAKQLGGRPTKLDGAPAVAFGKITISFARAKGPTGESVSSGIHHLGFSYPNIDAALQRLARSGVRIVSGVEKDGPIRYAFIHDPWSTLIEVVEDPEIRGFHHVHLATQNPKATLKWYTDVFGGKVSRFAGMMGGIREGDTWILVKGVDHPLKPTLGWAVDHVSWPVARFDETIKRLEAKGAIFESPPREARRGRSRFVEGPDGVRLELVRAAE